MAAKPARSEPLTRAARVFLQRFQHKIDGNPTKARLEQAEATFIDLLHLSLASKAKSLAIPKKVSLPILCQGLKTISFACRLRAKGPLVTLFKRRKNLPAIGD